MLAFLIVHLHLRLGKCPSHITDLISFPFKFVFQLNLNVSVGISFPKLISLILNPQSSKNIFLKCVLKKHCIIYDSVCL